MIFTSKVRTASLPFLNWGEDNSGSGNSYVISTVALAVEKLNEIHKVIMEEDLSGVTNFYLGPEDSKIKFFVYYGVYNGQNYYLLFRDEDPELTVGQSYDLILEGDNIQAKAKKCNWWTLCIHKTDEYFDVASLDKMDFLVYDAEKYYEIKSESLLCPEGKFCVTASLKGTGDEDYYFSHYIEGKDCKNYYSKTVFVNSDKDYFEKISKLNNCFDETEYAYDLFDELLENISERKTLHVSGLKNLNENFLMVFGLYNDGTGLKNMMILYDIGELGKDSVLNRHILHSDRYNNYEKISLDYLKIENRYPYTFSSLYYDLNLDLGIGKDINTHLIVPIYDFNELKTGDYIKNLEDYVLPTDDKAAFVPILYLYNNGYALIRRPYEEGHFLFKYPPQTFLISDFPSVQLDCKEIDGKEYCYFEPVRR